MRVGTRHFFVFVTVIVVLLTGTAWYVESQNTFRAKPIDLREVSTGSVVYFFGTNRRNEVSFRLGFAEKIAPSQLGAFGNHQIQYFSADAFGKPRRRDYFFNYFLGNLSLMGSRDYLQHLAHIGQLPAQTILVFVTTPNNDNGNNILGYNGNLPPEVVLNAALRGKELDIARVREVFSNSLATFRTLTRYSSIYTAVLRTAEVNVADFKSCMDYLKGDRRERYPGFLGKLPTNFLVAFGLYYDKCEMMDDFGHVLKPDGSKLERYEERPLNRNEFEISRETQMLFPGDEVKIAGVMQQIRRIASAHGRRLVFIIPPVYETQRQSAVDQIMDRAIALATDIVVIDHRKFGDRREFFVHYDHPGAHYYEYLANELLAKGLISPP